MKLTIELSGITNADVALFEKMSSNDLTIRVHKTEGFAKVIAFGSYDDLIPVIMQATSYKNYTIKLH